MNTTITPQKFIELDEMKQQLHILQDKFQKEVIINDTLIQESMKCLGSRNSFGWRLYVLLSKSWPG